MLRLYKYILLAIFLAFSLSLAEENNNKFSSYEGMHFFVGFMENEVRIADPNKQLEQKIFISSDYNTTAYVSFGGSKPDPYIINKDDIVTINVPRHFENYESEVVKGNLVEITSDSPISVYAYSSIPRSTDSYSAIPVSSWGTEYMAVSMPNDQYNIVTLDSVKDFTPRSSEMMIMAAHDNTIVTLIPSTITRKGKQIGQSYDITLNKGQCYLVQSWQYARGMGDLTGTIVRSDKPVGVLTGHVRTAILQGFTQQPPDSKDHLIEMLMPTSAWGNTFVTVPFGTNPQKGDYFKINSLDPNAVVDIDTKSGKMQIQFNGTNSQTINSINEPAIWRSSSPIQLAQFMMRMGDPEESVYYDPSLVIIPPVEQFVNKISFNSPDESFVYADGQKFENHYAIIIAEPEAITDLKIDGHLVSDLTQIENQDITDSDLKWARVELEAGKHNFVSENGRFAGILFGVGRFDSYAMTLGCSLQNPFDEDNIPPEITVNEDCGKLQGVISDEINEQSYGIYYAWVIEENTSNFDWKIDPILSNATEITFSAEPIDKYKDGKFTIDYMDKNGNKRRYSYDYNAIKLDYSKEIILPQMDYNDSICIDIPIRNLGKKAIDFLKTTLNSDSRITLVEITKPNSRINSEDSVILRLCINPKGNSTPFYGKINVSFSCDVDVEITFRGDLVALELKVSDLDFGDVQIGQKICSYVFATNYGNSDILIDSLGFNDYFQIDTLDMFPRLLAVDDTIYIPICFEPSNREFYKDSIRYFNSYNLKKYSYISGNGVAPLVKDIYYNFENVRIGTSKLLSEKIENSGNQDCYLSFEKFISQSHIDDDISQFLSAISNHTIAKGDSKDLDLTFVATDTNDYLIKAQYKTNWDLHEPVYITVSGKGTIPEIETFDVDFGTVEIFTQNELNPILIESNGNERLFIEKAFAYSGDIDKFDIDYAKFDNIYIDINSNFSDLIQFSPTELGDFEMTMAVLHDAMPNYELDTAFIVIKGASVQPQNYNVDISLVAEEQYSCQYNLATLKLHNTGEPVELTDLKLDKYTDDFIAEIMDFTPQIIGKNETLEYTIKLYADRNKLIKFRTTAYFFGLDSLSSEYEIMPTSGKIILDNINAIKYAAGDTVKIILSGKFNQDIDTLTGFYLSLAINSEHLLIINEQSTLNLKNISENLKYNLNISQTKDKLEFYISADLIKIIQNVNWDIELSFLGLLSDKIMGNWELIASSDRCFEPDTSYIITELDSVCVFESRHIAFDTENSHVNIYPNPATNSLRLKTTLTEAITDGRITIIDNLGIEYPIADNTYISKGINYLEYDISNFANGTYVLRFQSQNLSKNIIFVIIR